MARSKIELQGLVERVLHMYSTEKLSLNEITAILKTEGFDISRAGIHRSIKSAQQSADDLSRAAAEAQVLLDRVRDNPGTDLMEVALQLLASKMMATVQNVDSLDFDDPGDLIESLSSLARAQTAVGRLRMEFDSGVKSAKIAVERELTSILENEFPELLARLLDALDKIEITKADISRAKKSPH